MNTFIPGPPDAELALQASVTKTADFSGAWLDLGQGFAPGGLGMPVAGVVNVTALDKTDTDETYAFKLQQAADDGTGAADAATVEDIGAAVSATEVGIVLAKGFVTQRFVRLVLDVGGTTPSITYTGQLNP
jgi:hypothetical protein